MPPPPKAKLHKSTGRLKNINNSYVSSSSSSANSSNRSANTNRSNSSNVSSSGPNNAPTSENRTNAVETPAAEQFELELYWCIQTLENSLNSGKLNQKQVQDTEKTLRSLKSGNQPMVKKRQLMQSAFGDYRKKMADEEKKMRAGNTSIQFVDGSSKDAKTSANKSHFVKKSFATTFGSPDFRFNFPIDDMQKLSIEQTNSTANDVPASDGSNDGPRIGDASVDDKANDKKCTQTQNECSDVNKLDASSIEQSNPFIKSKFHISDNSFKFNFSIECD